MPVTGHIAGGDVAPRRLVLVNASGRIVHHPGVVPQLEQPAYGVSQPESRYAPGTPWAVLSGGVGLAAQDGQELRVFDRDGQQCELECDGTTAIKRGDKLGPKNDGSGIGVKVHGYATNLGAGVPAVYSAEADEDLPSGQKYIRVTIRRGTLVGVA